LRKWLNMIAFREGFGDVLAKGAGAAVKYIMEHEEFGPNRKQMAYLYGKVFSKAGKFGGFHRHHLNYPVGYLYGAVNTKGGMEPHAVPGTQPKEWLMKWFGVDNKIKDVAYWGDDVAAVAVLHDYVSVECDSAPYCALSSPAQHQYDMFSFCSLNDYLENSPHGTPEYLSAVFGEEVTQADLMKKYEKIINLERAIWIRDGYLGGEVDSFLPPIYEEVHAEGIPCTPKDKFLNQLQAYYQKREWKNGVPTRAKLEELDLEDVADELEKRGLAAN